MAVLTANTPEMMEMHFGIPMTGAIINTINTRLDAAIIGFILDHGEADAVFVDREFAGVMAEALKVAKVKPIVIDVDDSEYDGAGDLIGEMDYEAFIASGDASFPFTPPDDEWDAIALNYTSGTTGDPKGVVYSHRGTYSEHGLQCACVANAASSSLPLDAADVPLQRLVLPVGHRHAGGDACVPAPSAG